jgi:hypothetical protein
VRNRRLKRRHHLNRVKLLGGQILSEPLANRLARPRRARETREAAIEVLDLVDKVTHIIQTNVRPHPAVRNDLIEEPGKAGLLVVQICKELTEGRIKVRARI